jgi:hypothetical protein
MKPRPDNCTRCGKPRDEHKLPTSTCSYVAPGPKGRVPTSVLLDPELLDAVDDARKIYRANGESVTRSELVNRALRLYLNVGKLQK